MSAVAGLRTLSNPRRRFAAAAGGFFWCLWVAASLLPGCGDDDTSPPEDAGTDGGGDASTSPPPTRRDAGMMPTTTDPIPACDPADPSTCGSDEYCDLVLRRAAGEASYAVYTGCVQKRRERGLGDPCDPNPTEGELYSVPGLTDEVYTDPCGEGLTCAPDSKIRGGTTCQPVCSRGRSGNTPVTPIACKSSTQICLGGNGYVDFCRETDRCDVEKQSGCPRGSLCVLVPGGDRQSLLATCFPQEPMPLADGQTCETYSACNPGSVCYGPVRLPFARWADNDIKCRKICSDPSESDAGADDDAGVLSCPSGTRCAAFTETGLALDLIPNPPYGQCE